MTRLHALFALVLLTTLGGCANDVTKPAPQTDVAAGAGLIEKLGCGSCHTIPGIVDATGLVGPPLDHMGSRKYVAGVLRNTPENMVQWLRFPQKVVPGNAMPDLGISEEDAERITAYLATLK